MGGSSRVRQGKAAPGRSSAAASASQRPRRAARGAGTRTTAPAGQSPKLAPDVAAFLEAYQPNKRPVRDAWDVIGPDVRRVVSVYAPVSTARATQVMAAVAGLAAHQHAQQHSLAGADWLNRDAIDNYIASLPASPTTRTTHTRLDAVARANGALIEDRVLPPLPRTQVAEPYTTKELAAIRTHIDTRTTNRDQLLAVFLLGIGAGLDGREIPDVAGSDIVVGPHSLLVRAPGVRASSRSGKKNVARPSRPARLVPITAAVEADLAKLAMAAPHQPLAGDMVARTRDLSTIQSRWPQTLPRLEGGRLRATWIAQHLQRPVPVAALSSAGTGDGDRVFARLSGGVDPATYMSALRGTACCTPCHEAGRGAEPLEPSTYSNFNSVTLDEVRASLDGVRS